ncbi:hypothetical protein M426DRAFT_325631 [Hypoxylon sp. CI-4A]|nr:hypothetical protein M426DRAFT_325631 [Hypoxylon sp. CI-4A]
MSNQTSTPLLLRRNGRPQACDPCRKRKLACDHSQPVCSRCRKRKQDAQCVYIVPDPRALSSDVPLPSPTPSTSGSARRRRATPQPAPSAPALRPDMPVNPTIAGSGYMGPTSYCDIYEDTENSLSLLLGSETTTPQGDNVSQRNFSEGARNTMSARVRDMCLTVLRNVPALSPGNDIRTKLGSDGWARPVAMRVARTLYEDFADYFRERERPAAQLEELARLICANTAKPFSDDESDPERWLAQFTGRNLRWDALGVLFIFWQFIATSDTAALWTGKRTAEFDKNFQMVRENMRLCFELCREFSPGSSLMLYLAQRCTVVDSKTVGDANLLVWRSHAEAISLVTFLGFHALEQKDIHQTTFSAEIKKRLFHHMFAMSMVIVSFTGRPPLIAKRYSSAPLPLDLADEELFADQETFRKAVDRLDERGWNTDRKLYSSTWIRARSLIATIREELFQIALSAEHIASVETLLQIRTRELQMVSGFPECLKFNPDDLKNLEVPVMEFGSRLFINLEHLQNMFFIERLLLRCGHEDNGVLLEISYDLVTWTLPYYLHLDRLAPFSSDCEWLVMAYAVPAGGILCLELLKPTLHIRPHADPRITRSSIIQNLSLLVAYLDWVSPSGPNGDLCNDAKSVIQRVLDQTLNAASSVYEPSAGFEWDFSTQLDFNFDLLDTFDWNRPDFESSQQSH